MMAKWDQPTFSAASREEQAATTERQPRKDGRWSGLPKSTVGPTSRFGFLRVTSGRYKGLRLSSPGAPTHPMGAREKNALFNILQPWLAGATVLDAYAGSGALGLEALSRGAESVTFVENHPRAIKTLRSNLETIARATPPNHTPAACATRPDLSTPAPAAANPSGLAPAAANSSDLALEPAAKTPKPAINSRKTAIFPENIAKFSQNPRLAGHFSLIIADPPYDGFLLSEVLELANLLRNDGIFALSYPGKLGELELPGFERLTTRRYAAAGIGIYRKNP